MGFRREGTRRELWIEPPQPAVTLIVTLEGQLCANGRALPRAWIGGIGCSPYEVEFDGTYACVDLKLTPLGAYTLLASPVSELAGATFDLDEVFGEPGRVLCEELSQESGWERRFEVVESFLLARASGGPLPDPAVARAWSRLRETSGRLTVEALARELGCSRRYLATRFREQVGLPPKTLARLLRFERVRRLIESDPGRLADIAHSCGYCDQSHLNRDFRDLAGTTPGEFVARRVPDAIAAGAGAGGIT